MCAPVNYFTVGVTGRHRALAVLSRGPRITPVTHISGQSPIGVGIGTYKGIVAMNQGKVCEAGIYFALGALSGVGFLGALDKVSMIKDFATAGGGFVAALGLLFCG